VSRRHVLEQRLDRNAPHGCDGRVQALTQLCGTIPPPRRHLVVTAGTGVLEPLSLTVLACTTSRFARLEVRLEDGEFAEEAVVRYFRTTGPDGKRYEVAHYNLDMVIALGFRVRSAAVVRFRQWAADKLKEYIVKGFVLDDKRLKRADRRANYFDELLARIREIRASEAGLSAYPGDLRARLGLRRGRTGDAAVLRVHAEQDALRRHPAHGGRDRAAAGRRREAEYGPHELD
jgi:hypothetical protein